MYDSNGGSLLVLRQFPVVSVASVDFGGRSFSQAATGNPPANGFLLQSPGFNQQRLEMRGYNFPRGRSTVSVTYTTGWVQTQTQIVAESVVLDPMWLEDRGVVPTVGSAFEAVASAPGPGEYSVSAGVYTFNEDDVGREVAITFCYCPEDIEQAVIEIIGERYKSKERIGVASVSVPQSGTTSFSQKDMSSWARAALQPYARVAPI